MSRKRAILIAGPTASGKSAAALSVARAVNGVVINADSMQVYRELRVLSARPSEEDEAKAPHALYGFVPAAEAYSTGRWLEDVNGAIGQAERDARVPVITGGTGLYFKALLEGLSPVPDIPSEVRTHWRETADELGPEELHGILRERDPAMAEKLRPSDPQRIVRALEVLDATGTSLAEWQDAPGDPLLKPEETVSIFITRPRGELYARIDARFDRMLEQGALEEVETLARQELDPGLPAMRALGVRPLMAFHAGEMGRDAAIERAKTDSRRYAKRQVTWAQGNMIAWNWIEMKDSKSFEANLFSLIDV